MNRAAEASAETSAVDAAPAPSVATAPAPATAVAPRPMRADARRNYERILTVARQAFQEHGADASLDDIARRAEVGAGTLYRHFPNRSALLDTVYREYVQEIGDQADRLSAALPPLEAFTEWLRFLAGSMSRNHGLKDATVAENLDLTGCRELYHRAGNKLLQSAQDSGEIRTGIDLNDVFKFVHATTLGCEVLPDPQSQIDRLLPIVVDGLRRRD